MYIYSYLLCLYWCKDYCHRVTTQLQLVVVVVIVVVVVVVVRRHFQKMRKLIVFPTTNSVQKRLCETLVRTACHVGYNTQANLTRSVSGVL
jgi:ABC-type transport system involved in cytochrome bd biosynthesis fused ATPase/permease subunit